MQIYSDEKVVVYYYDRNSSVVDITFSGFTNLIDRQSFGLDSCLRLNHSSIIVVSRHNHYYHYDLQNLIKEIKKNSKKYNKKCLYGCGMGGYAALKLSKPLDANTVVIVSPFIGDKYGKEDNENLDYYINSSDISGEVFNFYDDKSDRDRKNYNYLKNIYKINDYPLSYAEHIAYHALKELNLIDMLFMGRGDIDLTCFFMKKIKNIFDNRCLESCTVFVNFYNSLDDFAKKNLIENFNYNKICISNYRVDKLNQILAKHYDREADKIYLQAISLEKIDISKAKELYLNAISLDCGQVYWKFQFARFLSNNKFFEEAINYYKEAINGALVKSAYSSFVVDWSNRIAILYEKIGKRKEAKKYYGLALINDDSKNINHQLRFDLNTNEFVENKRIIDFISNILPMCKDRVHSSIEKEFNKNIFVYWAQGFDDAPELIKKCLINIKSYTIGMNLILLDDNNIDEYLNIPKNIREAYSAGKIKHAHYSDILRLLLLKNHGGCWLDATCLLTSQISDQINILLEESNFFAFMYEKPMISNWFLVSKQDSYIVSVMLEALLEYWNSFLGHSYYFCFHSIFYSLYILDEEFKNELDKAMYLSTKIPHNLQVNMLNKYDESKFKEMINKCFVHKLTYKYDVKKTQGSNLEKILNSN